MSSLFRLHIPLPAGLLPGFPRKPFHFQEAVLVFQMSLHTSKFPGHNFRSHHVHPPHSMYEEDLHVPSLMASPLASLHFAE